MADAASQVLLGSGLTVLSQPLMYVKVLVQVRGGRERGAGRGKQRGPGSRSRLQAPAPAAGRVRAAAAHPGEEHLRPPGLPAPGALLLW